MNSIKYTITLTALTFTLFLNGCATSGKSIAAGGAIGAGTGAILGGIADPGKNGEFRTRNVIIGGAVGGMAGMLTGALIHDHTENQKQEAYEKGKQSGQKSAPSSGTPPSLSDPRVESKWIEGKVMGNRYIEGHWEYIISEPARWESN